MCPDVHTVARRRSVDNRRGASKEGGTGGEGRPGASEALNLRRLDGGREEKGHSGSMRVGPTRPSSPSVMCPAVRVLNERDVHADRPEVTVAKIDENPIARDDATRCAPTRTEIDLRGTGDLGRRHGEGAACHDGRETACQFRRRDTHRGRGATRLHSRSQRIRRRARALVQTQLMEDGRKAAASQGESEERADDVADDRGVDSGVSDERAWRETASQLGELDLGPPTSNSAVLIAEGRDLTQAPRSRIRPAGELTWVWDVRGSNVRAQQTVEAGCWRRCSTLTVRGDARRQLQQGLHLGVTSRAVDQLQEETHGSAVARQDEPTSESYATRAASLAESMVKWAFSWL